MDGKGTVPQLVQKMLMRIVRCKDVPMSLATMYVSAAAPFTHSTRKVESFGLSGFKMIQPKASEAAMDDGGGFMTVLENAKINCTRERNGNLIAFS